MNGRNEQTPPLKTRLVAFVRSIANECKSCVRRDCGDCVALRARTLVAECDAEKSAAPAAPRLSRAETLIAELARIGRPALSSEIKTLGCFSRAMKRWELRRLVKRGAIKMIFDGKHYLYSLTKKQAKRMTHETTAKGGDGGRPDNRRIVRAG